MKGRWAIGYFSEAVRLEIEVLPVGIRASFVRLTELIEEFGIGLGMPYSRAMGNGLFELRPRRDIEIARRRQREVYER